MMKSIKERPEQGLFFLLMRYHYEKPDLYFAQYGVRYGCRHPVYDFCTLYLINEKGLAVIQQRFDEATKSTYWTDIDPWLVDTIYLQKDFKRYFDEKAGVPANGLFPTVTVRQIMWALKMKPMKRECWETAFDHCPI